MILTGESKMAPIGRIFFERRIEFWDINRDMPDLDVATGVSMGQSTTFLSQSTFYCRDSNDPETFIVVQQEFSTFR